MAGKKERDLRKEALWRRYLQQHQKSGLSVRAFCSRQGLAESAFYFWRREIERRDGEVSVTRQAAFVPVVVQAVAESPIEVTLASGHVVRLRSGFDADTLRQLLAMLEEPSC
jgi:hypothetical protein